MSINVNVGANTGPLERDVRAAMDRINRAGGLKVRVDDKGVTQPLGNMKRSADEFSKSLEASNARVLAFGASVGIINAVSNAFKGLVQQTIVVEKNLTDINVVMGLTTQQLDRFGDGLFKVAAETGAGFKAASEAATEFARQGLSVTETLKRTKDALILTRLTGMKAADSVKSLTAAMNTFKGEIKDSTQLVSKFAAVDVKFAVSAEDFAQAIARAGASARDAGVDINELIGIVTAVQERTARGGAVIGNAFKTIFTRIRRSSTLQELENLGIAVRDVRGATLPAMKILQQLAVRYDGLTDSQKSYISQNVAGVFQVNMLKAAMSDLGKANNVTAQATNIASNATDESNRKNDQLRNTMSALATETGVAIQNLAKKIGDIALAPGINKILDGVKGIADFANGILGDGEQEGSRFAKGLLGGIGNFISGPGLVIITAVVSKLFINAAKYGMQSLQSLLGMNKAATARKHTEQAILQVLASNSALSKEMLRTDISREKKEQMILGLIRQQTIEAQKLAAVSKQLTMPLVRAGVAPNLSLRRADGFIPNFAIDKTERQLAAEGGYAAGAIKDMNIPGVGNVTYNTAEDVKKFPGMTQPAIVPPQGSKAGDNYDLAFQKAHGFSPYAGGGFVPNFAAKLPTTHIKDLNKYASDHGFKGGDLYSTAKNNRFGAGGAKDRSFRGGAIYLDANKLLGEPFMNTMGVMVGQGSNSLQKKNYTAALTSIPALKPLVAQLEANHKGAAANTRVRVGIKEKGLYPVDQGDVSSVSRKMQGGFSSTLKNTPGLKGAMDNLAGKVRDKIGIPADEVKIQKGSALNHVLGEGAWRGYMLEAGVKSAFGRRIDTGKESQRAFDLEGSIPQGLRDFMGMPLLRALELKSTEQAASGGGVANKVFNRIFNDYATGPKLRAEFQKRIGMASGAKAASGYVPNFANPLLDAIGREKDAGVPVSKIRVGSHKSLRAKSNPMGIGITNTSDEPNGLKDVFGAGGYVPNYAAPLVKNLGISGGGIVDAKQSKLLHKAIAKIHTEFQAGAIDIKQVRSKLANLGKSTKGVDDSLKLGKGTLDRLQRQVKSTTTSMGQFKAGMQGQGTGMMGRLGRFQSGQGTGKAAFLGKHATGMGGMGAMMGLSMGASFVRGDDPTDKFGQGAGGAMEGASTGMAMGMMFGPLGMAIGAAAGGALGLVSGMNKAEEAAKELAEAQKKAAESATQAAIAFALQNENLNASFAQNAQSGNKYDIGVTEKVKAAVIASEPDFGSVGTTAYKKRAAYRKARGDTMEEGVGGFFGGRIEGSNKVYESKSGGYTSNRSEARTVDSAVGSKQSMKLFDVMGQFNPEFGSLRKSLEKEGKTLTVAHVAKGLSEISPQNLEAKATRDGSKTTKELKELDQNTIIKMRHDFLEGIFNTDAEKSAKYNVGTEKKPIEKTGQQLLDELAPKEGEGSKALQTKLEEGAKIFEMIATEGEKALQVQELAKQQFIAKLNFDKAQLISQKSFSDRMHAMNMQVLRTNGNIDSNLKLYSNSIAASTRSRLLHDKKENEIENKLQQEKLKAAQSYKDSVIGFLNNDGGTGIGQELKNAINEPESMQNISAVLGEDIAKQFEAAKGEAGEMEKVLARLTNEQLTKLLSQLNQTTLSNSKITDFLDIQEDKLTNQNSLAENNAAISREKLSIEEKTNAILDARTEKLKNINIEMERIRNASKFMSEAAGLIVGNADLDSQISLARMGGGTQRQQFGASQASAQRKFISQKMLREQSQRDSLMNNILGNKTFANAGLLDNPDLSAEKLTQMTPQQLIEQVKSSAATRSTGLNEQLNQEKYDLEYYRPPLMQTDKQKESAVGEMEANIQALQKRIDLQQQASQEADKLLDNVKEQVGQHEAINDLFDDQYQKMKQLAEIQHEFVYGDNAFANGMNKAFAEARDNADRFKYDLGEALPRSFSQNMAKALSDITASGDFEEGMLNFGLNFFGEMNQMFTQNLMDQMMGAMLGDAAKSEQQQQIETTQQLKASIEGTLSSSITNLSGAVSELASAVRTNPAKNQTKYQGGPIKMNTGGQVPAMLTSGEFVMNKGAVSKLGKANMDLLNQGHIPRFSEGGSAGGGGSSSPGMDAFGSALGAGVTGMAMDWFQGKLDKKEAEKNKKWERPKDAFEQNRAYKRNRMSASFMQNSSDVQQEVSEIRMRKEEELQKWIAKQNKKQALGRQVVSMIGNAAVSGMAASLGSSQGMGSSAVKDAQGNVIKDAKGNVQRQSFFNKVDNTLGYKSFFADTSRTMADYSFKQSGSREAIRKASIRRKEAQTNPYITNAEQNYQNAVQSYRPVHKATQAQGSPYSGFNNRKEYEQSNRFWFNTGGKVTGPSGIDRVPAMLTEGEYVINARAAQKIGMPALESMNAGKYNEGGLVTDSTKKPGQADKSGEMTNNISINVTVNGSSTSEDSEKSSSDASDSRAQMDDLGKKIKQQVVTVIREENRPGGLLGK